MLMRDLDPQSQVYKGVSYHRSIIEHVHNQMAVFTLGHCSNLTQHGPIRTRVVRF